MAWSVQEKGSGPRRDLIVVAHGGVTDAIRAAAPGAIVVGLAQTPMKGLYASIGPDKVPPLAELVRGALDKAGGPELGQVVLCGFSEGCQAVRAWLAAGEVPSAVVAIDGIHGTKPAPSAGQVDPWRAFFARSRKGERFGVVTATRIPTVNYLPTATMLPIVTGFQPAPVLDAATTTSGAIVRRPDACAVLLALLGPTAGFLGVGAAIVSALSSAAAFEAEARAGEEAGGWILMPAIWGVPYQRIQQGLLVAEQWPGKDGAAHVQQAQSVMPRMIGEALSHKADPWISGYSSGPRPAEPGGIIWPAIPGGAPPGRPPATSPPASTPPATSPPATSPPAASEGGGGAAVAVLVLGLGLGGLALAKRRG